MKDPSMTPRNEMRGGVFFDTLSNTHPTAKDPRNDEDYDTFLYGTEPVPGDTTWAKYCQLKAGLKPIPQWKNAYQEKGK
jgi:hypothetical protein